MAARRKFVSGLFLNLTGWFPISENRQRGGSARFAEVRVHVLEGVGFCCKFRCKCSKNGYRGTVGAARRFPGAGAWFARVAAGLALGPMQPTREFHLIPT